MAEKVGQNIAKGKYSVATNKKPSKKYKPKPVLVLPKVFRQTIDADNLLKMIPHQELARLRDGTADEGTWHTLVCRLDWGSFMSTDHFDNIDVNDSIQAALVSMRSIKARFYRLNKWGVNAEEFASIGDALNLVDDMQSQTTRREQDASFDAMMKLNTQLLKDFK